jgi:DUF917 family protein
MAADAQQMGRYLSPADVEAIALGAGVLGSGGGGDAYLSALLVREALRRGERIRLIAPEAVPPGGLVIAVAQVGAPVVMQEKLARGTEGGEAFAALETHLGERAVAVACDEIGGTNSMTPLLVAANLDIPVLDADAMGRAFPDLYMDTLSIYGAAGVPCALCDDAGNLTILPASRDAAATERLGRAITLAMGGLAYLARPAPRDADLRRTLIPGSYSRTMAIGEALRRSQGEGDLARLDLSALGGRVLLHGTVTGVERRPARGPVHGTVTVEDQAAGDILHIEFQNEYLLARRGATVAAVVPDVIGLVDDETGEPISAEAIQAGRHVVVLGIRADARLTTPLALRSIGPAAFGYDVEYQALPIPGT